MDASCQKCAVINLCVPGLLLLSKQCFLKEGGTEPVGPFPPARSPRCWHSRFICLHCGRQRRPATPGSRAEQLSRSDGARTPRGGVSSTRTTRHVPSPPWGPRRSKMKSRSQKRGKDLQRKLAVSHMSELGTQASDVPR